MVRLEEECGGLHRHLDFGLHGVAVHEDQLTSNVNDTKNGSTNVPISKLIIGTKPKRFDVFQKKKSNVSI